jgi:hypothetical protein
MKNNENEDNESIITKLNTLIKDNEINGLMKLISYESKIKSLFEQNNIDKKQLSELNCTITTLKDSNLELENKFD